MPIHGITRVRVNTVDLKGEACKVDWIIVAQERFLMKAINDPSVFTDSRKFYHQQKSLQLPKKGLVGQSGLFVCLYFPPCLFHSKASLLNISCCSIYYWFCQVRTSDDVTSKYSPVITTVALCQRTMEQFECYSEAAFIVDRMCSQILVGVVQRIVFITAVMLCFRSQTIGFKMNGVCSAS